MGAERQFVDAAEGKASGIQPRLQIVFAELLDERRATQLEQARGVRDRSVGLIERRADQMLLDRAEMLAQIEPVARNECLREMLRRAATLADRVRQILAL